MARPAPASAPRPCVVLVPAGTAGAAPLRRLARRAGLRPVVARDADSVLSCALADDPLLIVLDARGAGADAPATVLRGLLHGIGRGRDLLVWGDAGGPPPRCPRQLKRRLRRGRLDHERALRAQAADPAWQALLADYAADLQQRMAELEAAVQRADAATALALVHDVKGSAGGYGFGHLTAPAAAAQDAFVADDAAAAFVCCTRLVALARGNGAAARPHGRSTDALSLSRAACAA